MSTAQRVVRRIWKTMLCVSLFITPLTAQGATINAASCSQTAVQAAIDSAADRDIVVIPAGTCTWTQTVNVGTQIGWNPPVYETKAITIQGAGMDKTIIIDNNPVDSNGNGGGMFSIATKLGGFTRVTGLTLDSSQIPNLDPYVYNRGMIGVGGFSNSWRVDHVHFIVGSGHGITAGDWTYGVIDHNIFDLIGWHFGVYIYHDYWNGVPNGDGSWADALYAGSDKAVFVEDNVFNGSPYAAAIDGWSGGRAVVRYNTLNNAGIANHGTDSPGRGRSMRSMEIYNNIITITSSQGEGQGPDQLRGGTFIIHDNTLMKNGAGGYTPGAFVITNYRDFDEFSPWGKCDGTSPFDLNDNVVYDTGTHTGASSSNGLVSSGKSWATNQWQGYHVHNLTKNLSDLIISNTADTITTLGLTHHSPMLTWSNGDSFKILRAAVCLDQRGRGKGNLISGDAPPWGTGITPQAWPNQALEPTYVWNNTLNGSPFRVDSQNPWRMQEGRDFFNSPMSGYAPYTYPHPLTSAGGGNPNPPSAPRNLRIR